MDASAEEAGSGAPEPTVVAEADCPLVAGRPCGARDAGSAGGATAGSGGGKVMGTAPVIQRNARLKAHICEATMNHRPSRQSGRYLLQHLDANLARCDLAERHHGGLVLCLDLGRVALHELTCTVRRGEGELEAVRDVFQTIFDGNTRHIKSTLG
ncbi:hypothetical protein Rmet_6430 [Cupriavidus metallidurans CH34]|uniref:Uncharacterized protein n=1 Tax=Cupriavidus metallidurans (strain ATCC 43123 / DSM 2839 / NBRC 102507 / CH34) TaxID=266264 RepID=D3DXM7_CUPMC|nr:hypothetical protein Rmet_6430 [Cupriavidus metallidurans CH34]